MFRPVKTKKVYEEIVEQIKLLMSEGKLQPGDKLLSERELAERLKVSRASVREAFSALEMMGVIEIKPGEGSFVRQVSLDNLMEPLAFMLQLEFDNVFELLEVRKILEVEAAGMAAHRATKEDLTQMEQALDAMIRDINSGELGDRADADFHFAIAQAAHNSILNRMMGTISDLMLQALRSSRQKLFTTPGMPTILLQQHQRIYEAIVAGDPKLARQAMYNHLAMVEKEMLHFKQIATGGESTKGKVSPVETGYLP